MENIFIRVIKQGKDGGSFQCGIIFHPLFRRLEQVALLKPNALHERLDCQNVVFRAVCRLGCRNASRCTQFIGTANSGLLSGKEAVDVIAKKDDLTVKVADLGNLVEHAEEVAGLLMPPAENIVRLQPLLECVQARVQGLSVHKVLTIPARKGHVIPILVGAVFRAEEHRESIHRIPRLIDAAGGELRWPMVAIPICDPFHIDQNIHLCHPS